MIGFVLKRLPAAMILLIGILTIAVAGERENAGRPADSAATTASVSRAGMHKKTDAVRAQPAVPEKTPAAESKSSKASIPGTWAHTASAAQHQSGRRGKNGHSAEWHREIPAELQTIPALSKRMTRLNDILRKRHQLQVKRQVDASQTTNSREVIVKRFHTLLREDMALAENARQIMREIGSDMPRIEQQIAARRSQLKEQLAAGNLMTSATAEIPTSGTREINRHLRYLDFIERKVHEIGSHPERLDLPTRILRGAPPDGQASSTVLRRGGVAYNDRGNTEPMHISHGRPKSPSEKKLDELKRRKRVLQRQLREIDERIEKLQTRK